MTSSDRLLRPVALALALLSGWGAAGSGVMAQVVTDGTLGAAATLDGPSVTVPAALGRRAGPNLVHSFAAFGVRQGQVVTLAADPGTENVIGRVTGGAPSRIDGALDAGAGAAVWLINPAGIDVGPGAQLRAAGGTFLHAGDTLHFADGQALATGRPALTLSSAAPVAFGFLDAAPGRLTVTGSQIAVRGRGLALSGGAVTLEGAGVQGVNVGPISLLAGGPGDRLTPTPSGTRVGSAFSPPPAGGTLRISGGSVVGVSTLPGRAGAPNALAAGEVTLSDGALVGALAVGSGVGGGAALAARRILITTGGQLRSQTQGAGDSGLIEVLGFETLTIGRDGATINTGIESDATPTATGAAGAVALAGRDALVRADGRVFSSTRGPGDAGVVAVTVETLRLEGGGQIGAGALDLPSAPGAATGAGGRVDVVASRSVVVTGEGLQTLPGTNVLQPSGVFTSTEGVSPAAQPAGAVRVAAPVIVVDDAGEISSESFNAAPAGAVLLEPGLSLTVDRGAEITTRATAGANAGRIAVTTGGTVFLGAGAEISSTAETGAGRAGAIALEAGSIAIRGGRIASDAVDGGAGAVTLRADTVTLDGGALSTVTRGAGPGGMVAVEAGLLALSGAARIATDSLAAGAGGDAALTVGRLTLDGAGTAITAESAAAGGGPAGPAGNLRLTLGTLALGPGTTLSTASASSAGGGVAISVVDLAELRGGAIATSVAAGAGDGGAIGLDARFIVLDAAGVIRANAVAGDGGDITLNALAVVAEPGAVIEAVSVSGNDGAITVIGAATAPTAELRPPPADFFDRFALIDDACVAAVAGGSALTVAGPETAPAGAGAQPGLFGGALAWPVAAPAFDLHAELARPPARSAIDCGPGR